MGTKTVTTRNTALFAHLEGPSPIIASTKFTTGIMGTSRMLMRGAATGVVMRSTTSSTQRTISQRVTSNTIGTITTKLTRATRTTAQHHKSPIHPNPLFTISQLSHPPLSQLPHPPQQPHPHRDQSSTSHMLMGRALTPTTLTMPLLRHHPQCSTPMSMKEVTEKATRVVMREAMAEATQVVVTLNTPQFIFSKPRLQHHHPPHQRHHHLRLQQWYNPFVVNATVSTLVPAMVVFLSYNNYSSRICHFSYQ